MLEDENRRTITSAKTLLKTKLQQSSALLSEWLIMKLKTACRILRQKKEKFLLNFTDITRTRKIQSLSQGKRR